MLSLFDQYRQGYVPLIDIVDSVYQEKDDIAIERKYPTAVAVPTPMKPGSRKLWFKINLPILVVPVRSKLMAAKSLG